MTDFTIKPAQKPLHGAILGAVADAFQIQTPITAPDKKGKAGKAVSRARWAAMILLQEVWGLNYNRIALVLGGMDRTSVIHGLKRGFALLGVCPEFTQAVETARRNAYARPLASPVTAKPRRGRVAVPKDDGTPPAVKFEALGGSVKR